MSQQKWLEPHEVPIRVVPGLFAVCQLAAVAALPDWVRVGTAGNEFLAVTRTPDELSIVCAEGLVPANVVCQRGWRALKIEGTLDFTEVGILASLAAPLAGAGISIFVISTYNTDYILVRTAELERAVAALTQHGFPISRAGDSQDG